MHELGDDYEAIVVGGETPEQTVSRLLQELRDIAFLTFTEDRGNYTVSGILLEKEKEDLATIDVTREDQNKREYLQETYIRSTKLVKLAKEKFGRICFMDDCRNSFLTTTGEAYIEVHHIMPLYKDGEDTLENLSVLCAHHHRMAHFAETNKVLELQARLQQINKSKLA